MTNRRRAADDAAATILGAMVAEAPGLSRRMRLKTLLAHFGLKKRLAVRLKDLQEALERAGLAVVPELASAGREDWINLSAGHAVPDDQWLATLPDRIFGNEKEVEIRFVVPLLERLGYSELDRADGHAIRQVTGSKETRTEADFVLFDGAGRCVDDALMVVEAKGPGKVDFGRYAAQARSYAMHVGAPLFLVTNGAKVVVYLYRGPLLSEIELFRCDRPDVARNLERLRGVAGKASAVGLKREIAEAMQAIAARRTVQVV